MFLGCAQDHTGNTQHMLNLRTKFIVLSRDVIWRKKSTESTYQENKIIGKTQISYKMNMSPLLGHTKMDPVNNEVKTKKLKTE